MMNKEDIKSSAPVSMRGVVGCRLQTVGGRLSISTGGGVCEASFHHKNDNTAGSNCRLIVISLNSGNCGNSVDAMKSHSVKHGLQLFD